MNKKELVKAVAAVLATTRTMAEKHVDAFIDGVTKGVKRDGRVQLVGFGSFRVKQRAPRRGRNPQTGEPMQVGARKSVTFKAGKPIKRAL